MLLTIDLFPLYKFRRYPGWISLSRVHRQRQRGTPLFRFPVSHIARIEYKKARKQRAKKRRITNRKRQQGKKIRTRAEQSFHEDRKKEKEDEWTDDDDYDGADIMSGVYLNSGLITETAVHRLGNPGSGQDLNIESEVSSAISGNEPNINVLDSNNSCSYSDDDGDGDGNACDYICWWKRYEPEWCQTTQIISQTPSCSTWPMSTENGEFEYEPDDVSQMSNLTVAESVHAIIDNSEAIFEDYPLVDPPLLQSSELRCSFRDLPGDDEQHAVSLRSSEVRPADIWEESDDILASLSTHVLQELLREFDSDEDEKRE
jgi:hypothetical protein